MTNLTPNHLDRYDGSMARYAEAKMNLISAGKPVLLGESEYHQHYSRPYNMSTSAVLEEGIAWWGVLCTRCDGSGAS